MSESLQNQDQTSLRHFTNGGVGGIFSVFVGHPLDTVKVRMQSMPTSSPGEVPIYKDMGDCMRKTIAKEGVLGLYKGMSVPLATVVPIFAVCFMGYNFGKQIQFTEQNSELTPLQNFYAGAFSGVTSTPITAPGERIKCLLQVQDVSEKAEKKYKNMFDCAKKLYKSGGLSSVFRGTCATALRDIPSHGIHFMIYESIQSYAIMNFGNEIAVWSSLIAGGIGGMGFWILGMPADVLKTRLQTSGDGVYEHGIRSVFQELVQKEGLTCLYRGVVPIMFRSFPANAACFFGYEVSDKFLRNAFPNW